MNNLNNTIFYVALIIIFGCQSDIQCDNMTHNDVCVTIKNNTGFNISLLNIFHENDTLTFNSIENNSSQTILFRSPGENAMIISAITRNDTIVSQEEYIEGGYRLNVIVTSDTMNIEYASGY